MTLLALIPLCGFVFFVRRMFGFRTSAAILHAVSAIILVEYLASLAGVLLPTTWLIWAAGGLLLFYELFRHRPRTALMPLIVLVLLTVVVWFFHHDGQYAYYDEYSYWGLQIKDMLMSDRLWGADSNVIHRRYVPGVTLWQYWFLRPVAYGDGPTFIAQFVLLFAPLTVLWSRLEYRQIAWVLGIFALVIAALTNFGHGVASLYVDHVLGAWVAGLLINFMLDLDDRRPRRLLVYALPVTTLVLTKDAGVYFAAVAIGIAAVLFLTRRADDGPDESVSRKAALASGFVVVCVVAGLMTMLSWNLNRDAAGVPSGTVSLSGIAQGIVSGETNLTAAEQQELRRRFRDVVFNQQISKDEVSTRYNAFTYGITSQFADRFRLTTASTLVLFSFWLVAMLVWLVPRDFRWRVAIAGAGLIAATIVYLAILYMSYRFAFEDRGLALSSYIRYLHTAMLPVLLFAFLPLLPAFSGDRIRWSIGGVSVGRKATLFGALLLSLYVVETPYLRPAYTASEAPPIRAQLAPLTEKLIEVVGDDRLWVYLPIPDSNGLFGRIIKFQTSPVPTEVSVDPGLLHDDPERVRELVAAADYVWLPVATAEFDARFEAITGADPSSRVLRVVRDPSGIRLVGVEGVFD